MPQVLGIDFAVMSLRVKYFGECLMMRSIIFIILLSLASSLPARADLVLWCSDPSNSAALLSDLKKISIVQAELNSQEKNLPRALDLFVDKKKDRESDDRQASILSVMFKTQALNPKSLLAALKRRRVKSVAKEQHGALMSAISLGNLDYQKIRKLRVQAMLEEDIIVSLIGACKSAEEIYREGYHEGYLGRSRAVKINFVSDIYNSGYTRGEEDRVYEQAKMPLPELDVGSRAD